MRSIKNKLMTALRFSGGKKRNLPSEASLGKMFLVDPNSFAALLAFYFSVKVSVKNWFWT